MGASRYTDGRRQIHIGFRQKILKEKDGFEDLNKNVKIILTLRLPD